MELPAAYLRSSKVLYELEAGEITVGRGAQNDIVLTESKSISNKHARLIVRPGSKKRAKLIDVGSTNGTFVNQTLLKDSSAELHTGDIIRFGFDSVQYRFDFHEENESSEAVEQHETAAQHTHGHEHGTTPSRQYNAHAAASPQKVNTEDVGSPGLQSQRIQSPTNAERRQREENTPHTYDRRLGGGHNDSAETVVESHSPGNRAAGISTQEQRARTPSSGEPPKLRRDPAHPGQNGSTMNDILYGGGYGEGDDRFTSSARSSAAWNAAPNSSPLTAPNVRTSDQSRPEEERGHSPSSRSPDLQRSADKSARDTLAQSLRESHHKVYKDSPQRATTGLTATKQRTTHDSVRHSAGPRTDSNAHGPLADTAAEVEHSRSHSALSHRNSQKSRHTRANSSPPGCADLSKRREERRRAQEQLRAMVRRDRSSQRKARLRAASAASRSAMEAASNTMKELNETVEQSGTNNVPEISVVYPSGPNPYAGMDRHGGTRQGTEPGTEIQTRPADACLNMTKDSLQSEANDQAHDMNEDKKPESVEQVPEDTKDTSRARNEAIRETNDDLAQSQAAAASGANASNSKRVQRADADDKQYDTSKGRTNGKAENEKVGKPAKAGTLSQSRDGGAQSGYKEDERRSQDLSADYDAIENVNRDRERRTPDRRAKSVGKGAQQRDRSNSSPSRDSSGESDVVANVSPNWRSNSWSGKGGRFGSTGGDGIVIQSFNGNLILGEDARKKLSESSQSNIPMQYNAATPSDHTRRQTDYHGTDASAGGQPFSNAFSRTVATTKSPQPISEPSSAPIVSFSMDQPKASPSESNQQVEHAIASQADQHTAPSTHGSATSATAVSEALPITTLSQHQSQTDQPNEPAMPNRPSQYTAPSNHGSATTATHIPETVYTTNVGQHEQAELSRLREDNERKETALENSENKIRTLEQERDTLQEKLDLKTAELKHSLERERSHGQDVTELMKKISSLRSVGIATSQKAALLLLDSVCKKTVSRNATRLFYQWKLSTTQDHLREMREEVRTLRMELSQKEEAQQEAAQPISDRAEQQNVSANHEAPQVTNNRCEVDVPSGDGGEAEPGLNSSLKDEEPGRSSDRDEQLGKLIELLSKFFADESPRESVEELSSAISSTRSHKSERRKAPPTVEKIAKHLYKAQELAQSSESDDQQVPSESSSDSDDSRKPKRKKHVEKKPSKSKKTKRVRKRRHRTERRSSSSTSSESDASKPSATEDSNNGNQKHGETGNGRPVDNNATMDPTTAERLPQQHASSPDDSYGLALGRELQRQFEHKQQAMMFANPNSAGGYSAIPPPHYPGVYSSLPPINNGAAPRAPPRYPHKQQYYFPSGGPYESSMRGPAYFGNPQIPTQPHAYQRQVGNGFGTFNQAHVRPMLPGESSGTPRAPPPGTAPQYTNYKW